MLSSAYCKVARRVNGWPNRCLMFRLEAWAYSARIEYIKLPSQCSFSGNFEDVALVSDLYLMKSSKLPCEAPELEQSGQGGLSHASLLFLCHAELVAGGLA